MSQPPFPPYEPASLTCPKCGGSMRTYDRNGVHIEQCATCRGVFLDFGELEHLTQLENRFLSQPAPAPGPAHTPQWGPDWGYQGGHRYRRKGFGSLFFSS